MNEKLNLVMPMAGAGTRFAGVGYECPKPLIPLHGKPFFYWAVESVRAQVEPERLRFVVLREHIDRFGIDREIRRYYPQGELIVLPQVLPGAVLTCLEGIKGLPDQARVLFNDCDHLFSAPALGQLALLPADGALLTFRAREPKFSFLELDEGGRVLRTVEKQVISDIAICGAYYFRQVAAFRRYAERYLSVCQYSEFFMSGVYNEMIADGKWVSALPTQLHISFGTPREYEAAKENPWFEEQV